LLNESGIAARGYDVNRIAVEECRQRGLDVVLADAIGALAGLPDGSASAITGFHIIEHLAFEVLVELFDHSWRVLRPGGLIIMETPNPANVIVAAEKFYFDPTHRNPLPSELTAYLLESRGFLDIEIVPLHPVTWPSRRDYDDPMLVYVQNKLFGPQDYAAIGRKIS
jgi:O-antigen chain-terminating methyltransferase